MEIAPFIVSQKPVPHGNEWQWFHIVHTTYGAWLYGDPRGFRTRHHREHIKGDYKNPPPPGMYDEKERRSQRLMTQPEVSLTEEWQQILGRAIVEKWVALDCHVLCAAVARQHVHLLVKLPLKQERLISGRVKKHAWFIARDYKWVGKLWGKRGKYLCVKDRAHQRNAYLYILRHLDEGAWVWDYKRGELPRPEKRAST